MQEAAQIREDYKEKEPALFMSLNVDIQSEIISADEEVATVSTDLIAFKTHMLVVTANCKLNPGNQIQAQPRCLSASYFATKFLFKIYSAA
jgi:hypothetical protein